MSLFNDTATIEIYTLSLHDALPISLNTSSVNRRRREGRPSAGGEELADDLDDPVLLGLGELRVQGERQALRSEEHTSELQSRQYLVCRLLLEKKRCCISCR